MNKIKKIIAGTIIAMGVGCLVGAVGCDKGPAYYNLTFQGKGLDYVFCGALVPEEGDAFVNGGTVKSGVLVEFTLSKGADTEGEPVILLNGEPLTPDENGVYSFTMSQNSVITAEGITEKKTVEFAKGDWRIKYLDEEGEEITGPIKVSDGSELKFKVWVSPYYVDKYSVTNDTEVLEADADGYYTISNVTANSTVAVDGLTEANTFVERKAGSGTESDPFIITTPMDLYAVATLTNAEFYTYYASAHYKLGADIDMEGEQLFVIGDNSNATATFMGTFDGDGHTISNFYITDEAINQSTFLTEYLPYVGLFGTAAATLQDTVVIKNLTLKDYTIQVHPEKQKANQATYAGSLIGYGIGVEVINCKTEGGKMTSIGNDSNMAYLGGMVGLLQSAYRDDLETVLTYDSYVYGCTSDVDIQAVGSPRSAGGIVGYISTADISAIAYVSNCVYTGSVFGAMHAGGIVGSLGRYSSVNDCYVTGTVYANNTIGNTSINSDYRVAYAGGIVGYAENDCAISGCYADSVVLTAIAVSDSKLAQTGDIAGRKEAYGYNGIGSEECAIVNSFKRESGHTIGVFEQLGWSESEWDLSGAQPVVIIPDSASKITLTVMNGESKLGDYEKTVNKPTPIYAWYNGGQLPQYVTSGSARSWGYYFDKELKNKVPYGYIPSGAQTLYVGFADYGEVAGTYHVGATNFVSGAYVTLTEDGKAIFRNGGMSFECTYTYSADAYADRNSVIIYNSCFASLLFTVDQINGAYANVALEKATNGYTIIGSIYVTEVNETTGEPTFTKEQINLTAVKEVQNFAYGEYKGANGSTVIFKKDGTVVYLAPNGQRQDLSYTLDNNGNVTVNNGTVVSTENGKATVFNNVALSYKDKFAGEWSVSANSAYKYVFDGIDSVSYVKVSTNVAQTATYEVVDGKATFTIGGNEVVASIGEDGMLYIAGSVYCRADGFTGVWYGTVEGDDMQLQLFGIGANGYGDATVTYNTGLLATLHAQYAIGENGVMRIYVGDTLYGELSLDNKTSKVSGNFYSLRLSTVHGSDIYATTEFNRYDAFKGQWITDMENVAHVAFSGMGGEADGARALLTDNSGKITTGKYVLDKNDPLQGTLTVGELSYTIVLDEATQKITITKDGTENVLAHYDEWQGVVLYDGETSYTFDGKSKVGGKISLSTGSTLTYTFDASGSLVIDGVAVQTTQSGFVWGTKTLVFKTGFASTWLVSGSNKEITVSEVGSDFKAQVTLNGETLAFTYQPSKNALVYSDALNGAERTITLNLLGTTELGYSVKSINTDEYLKCIKDGLLDEWKGEYLSANGDSWKFDGHGKGVYSDGEAVYTANGVSEVCKYRIDALGAVSIRRGDATYVFTQVEEGGFVKEGETQGYDTVKVDALYLKEVKLGTNFYLIDGMGNLWTINGEEYAKSYYTYKVLTSSRIVLIDVVIKQIAVLEKNGLVTELITSEYKEYTLTGTNEKYIFDGANYLWLVEEDGSYTRKYYYTPDSEEENIFYLTDFDNKKFVLTIENTNIKIEEDKK